MAKYVDYFNIMTYDYDTYAINVDKYYCSPISWIKNTIDFYVDKNDKDKNELLKKILFGLPFHGYVYDKKNGKPVGVVNTRQFLDSINLNLDKFSVKFDENEYEYTIENDRLLGIGIDNVIRLSSPYCLFVQCNMLNSRCTVHHAANHTIAHRQSLRPRLCRLVVPQSVLRPCRAK